MNFTIDYLREEDRIKVEYFGDSSLKIEFVDVDAHYGIYKNTMSKNTYSLCNVSRRKTIRILLCENNTTFYVFDVLINDKTYRVLDLSDGDFDYNSDIIFITGHAGGGTSVVAKALRKLGIYLGADCGNISLRKTHESIALRFWLQGIKDDITVFEARESFKRMAKSYAHSDSKINAFKYPDLGRYSTLLGDMFPNCKFISVIKNKNSFISTAEGKRFIEAPGDEVLKIQRPLIEGQPVFHLDFKKFFTDFTYVNKVLKYLNSTCVLRNQNELDKLKTQIEFDDKALS